MGQMPAEARRRFGRAATLATALMLVAACSAERPADEAATATATDAAATGPATGPEPAARPEGLITCEVVAARTTPEDCSYYEQLEAATERGVAAFNVPRTMQRDKAETLLLSLSFAPEELVADYADAAGQPTPEGQAPLAGPASTVSGGTGETTPFVPIVGRHMRATLAGRGFEVKALSPELQEVPREGETVWQWQVTPRQPEGGPAELLLTTSVVAVGPDGTERVLKRTARAQRIEVEVGLSGQVEDALKAVPKWVGYLAAIGTALGALFAAWKWLLPALKGGRPPAG